MCYCCDRASPEVNGHRLPPWHQRENFWELSLHFHVLCYGYLQTERLLKENPGWIIKKVHPREHIRSIRHTAAYPYTHKCLGLLDRMVPGIESPMTARWNGFVPTPGWHGCGLRM